VSAGDTDAVIRLVATDLDGTLWGADLTVPVQHSHAIGELACRGVAVLAATSRRARVVRPCLERAGLWLPAVLLDGAVGVDFRTGARFHQAIFAPHDAAAALEAFRSSGLEPCVYVDDPDVDVVVSETPSTCADHLASLGSLARAEDLSVSVVARTVYAFSVAGVERQRLEPVTEFLSSSGAQVVLFAEPRFGGFSMTVNPPGVSKWSGVDTFCRRAGISASEVLAVGDGDNDLPMLAQAAIAVAVRGGSDRVLAAADHLIDPPNKHGWAALVDLVR